MNFFIWRTIALFIVLHNLTGCKAIRNNKTKSLCKDDRVICYNNKIIGKIFYEADSSIYLNHFEKVIIDKERVIGLDSLISNYVINHEKSTYKIKVYYNEYFRQYLVYKDSGTIYINIAFHKHFQKYLLEYWTEMDDGHDDYFNIKYDFSNKKIIKYKTN